MVWVSSRRVARAPGKCGARRRRLKFSSKAMALNWWSCVAIQGAIYSIARSHPRGGAMRARAGGDGDGGPRGGVAEGVAVGKEAASAGEDARRDRSVQGPV